MFCTRCGAEVTEGMKFCNVCGAPVEKRQTTDAFAQNPTRVLDAARQPTRVLGAASQPTQMPGQTPISAQPMVPAFEQTQQPYPGEMPLDAFRDTGAGFEPALSGEAHAKRSLGKGAIAGIVAGAIVVVVVVVLVVCVALGVFPSSQKTESASSDSAEVTMTAANNENAMSNVSAVSDAAEEVHATSDEPATSGEGLSSGVGTGSFNLDDSTHYATCNLFLDNFSEAMVSSLDADNPDMLAYTRWAETHIFINRKDLLADASKGIRIKESDLSDVVRRYTGVELDLNGATGTYQYLQNGYYCDVDYIFGTATDFCLITGVNYQGNDTYDFTFKVWPGFGAERENTASSDLIHYTESEATAKYGATECTGTATIIIHDPSDESTYTLVKYNAQLA